MQGAQSLKILLIEDNLQEAMLFQDLLADFPGFTIDLIHIETLRDACQYLNHEHVDLILLDLSLPDSQGLETVSILHCWS